MVVAVRNSEPITDLGGHFRLQPADVLVLVGDHAQIMQARRVFKGMPPDETANGEGADL